VYKQVNLLVPNLQLTISHKNVLFYKLVLLQVIVIMIITLNLFPWFKLMLLKILVFLSISHLSSTSNYGSDQFVVRSQSATRGHSWKLFPRHYRTTARKHFFCERVIAPWNYLSVNNKSLGSITSFKRLIKGSNLSPFV